MPTKKPRVTFAIDEEMYDQIDSYRFETHQKNQTQAIISLLRRGIGLASTENKSTPSVTDEALNMAKSYDALDKYGKQAVKTTIENHMERMEEQKKASRSKQKLLLDFDAPTRSIPLYLTPPAAGYAAPAFGEDFEYIEVGGDVPAFADFAVKIDGDSMAPYIADGSIVYVNRDPLANGDIGIFYCDGDVLCKQYYKDKWGGVWLLSLNRDQADADRFIDPDGNIAFTCYGRVILPNKVSLAVPEDQIDGEE